MIDVRSFVKTRRPYCVLVRVVTVCVRAQSFEHGLCMRDIGSRLQLASKTFSFLACRFVSEIAHCVIHTHTLTHTHLDNPPPPLYTPTHIHT